MHYWRNSIPQERLVRGAVLDGSFETHVEDYDALPPDIEEDFSRAFGSKIAHTFTTGWEIGALIGIEKRKKEHKGEYIVRYPSEQKPYWHNLSKGEYGVDRYWVMPIK